MTVDFDMDKLSALISQDQDDDILSDAESLLARAIIRTHLSIPQDAVKCLLFLEQSGCEDLATEFLAMRRYLSPGSPKWLSSLMESLALKKYMNRIQIALGGK